MNRNLQGAAVAFCACVLTVHSQTAPKLPIGMNLPSLNYWTTSFIFTDVMTTASPWLSFNATGSSPWNTELVDRIEFDSNGYPLEIPAAVSGQAAQAVRFLFNNFYPAGRYVLLYDGEGDMNSGSFVSEQPGRIV